MFKSRNKTEKKTDGCAKENCLSAKTDGCGQPCLQQVCYRNVGGDVIGNAEVTFSNVEKVSEIANEERIVKTVFLVKDIYLFLGELIIVERRTGHEVKHKEQKKEQDENCDQGVQNSLKYVFLHWGIPLLI